MSDYPLVTAILPTRGRQALAKQALECWYAQRWPNKEIVIADDKEDRSFPKYTHDTENVHWFGLVGRLTVGEKRNFCCAKAKGEFVIHWDSDDWSSPDRIEDQMARLLASGKSVTGYDQMLFTNGTNWWRYEGQVYGGLPKGVNGVFGTSLCYRRNWWTRHRFVDGPKNFSAHEDKAFILAALQEDQLVEAPAKERMFARIHADNTSPKGVGDRNRWKPITNPDIIAPLLMMSQSLGSGLPRTLFLGA